MTQVLQSRPFAFDTEFDASGVVVTSSAFQPTKRAYLPAEVEALVAQAAADARQAALNESAGMQAMALASVGQAVADAVTALTAVAQAHREQSVAVALSAARVVAAAALDRFPAGPLNAALESMCQEIDASPRLVIRAGGLDEATRAELERVCADAGFSGLIAFRDEPGMTRAAFALEWADGRAEFDPHEAEARVAAALAAALAAEAGHAENLAEGRSS